MADFLTDKNMLAKIQSMYDPYALTVYDGMTLARHHVFSAYNYAESRGLDSFKFADKAIDVQYKGDRIDLLGGMGVGVELLFYRRFKKKLTLIPALDCGDHTDFAGFLNGKLIRIDVTLYDIESSKEKERWKFYVRDGKGGFKMVKDITAKSI